jgi:hypothetical protein
MAPRRPRAAGAFFNGGGGVWATVNFRHIWFQTPLRLALARVELTARSGTES